MVNTKSISDRIREKGMNQTGVSEALGIRQSTLSLKINNKRPLYLDEAMRLARILDIPDCEFGLYFFAQ